MNNSAFRFPCPQYTANSTEAVLNSQDLTLQRTLISAGLSPLPIAPAFPATEYPQRDKNGAIKRDKAGNPLPAFCGKNPSYLDPHGFPHPVSHKVYQDRLPTEEEIMLWWANPQNGVGYLHTSLAPGLRTLDLDRKNFDSQASCDAAFQAIAAVVPGAWIDRSQGGGYHVALDFGQNQPDFTNFGINGLKHAGELLGVGRFVAIAPTQGYSRIQDGGFASTTIDALGITPPPSKAQTPSTQQPIHRSYQGFGYGSIPLEMLGNPQSQDILAGADPAGDRSASLTAAVKEWMGWSNWCETNGVAYRHSPEELAHAAGAALGIDADRVGRILATISPGECTPAAQTMGGDDSCWKRVAKLDRRYQSKAYPAPIAPPAAPPAPAQEPTDAVKAKADRLKMEMLALQKESDPVLRMMRETELCSHYGIAKKDLERCIKALQARSQGSSLQCFTMAELLALSSEGLDWVVPSLLPRGEMALLAGSPGAGKSSLAVDLAFAVATGEADFLGETPKQGRVLYVTVDESINSTARKFLNRGLRADDENLRTVTGFDMSKLNELEAEVEAFRPDLVVVDSLKRITVGTDISENDSAFANFIYTLKETFGRYDAASVLIHHTNKGESQGIDKVRGSTGITGAVWGVWCLEKVAAPKGKDGEEQPQGNDYQRKFYTPKMRDAEQLNLIVEMEPDRYSYRVVSDAGMDGIDLSEFKTTEEKILAYLKDGTPRAKKEILAAIGGSSTNVYKVVSKLVDRKILSQRPSKIDKRSVVVQYRCDSSEGSTPPPPSKCEILNSKMAESLTPQGVEGGNNLFPPPANLFPPLTQGNMGGNTSNPLPVGVSVGGNKFSPSGEGGGQGNNSPVTVETAPSMPVTPAPSMQPSEPCQYPLIHIPGAGKAHHRIDETGQQWVCFVGEADWLPYNPSNAA